MVSMIGCVYVLVTKSIRLLWATTRVFKRVVQCFEEAIAVHTYSRVASVKHSVSCERFGSVSGVADSFFSWTLYMCW